MNNQTSFFQNVLPFLLIALLIGVAVFVYKNNPEIMNPEPYYKALQKQGELAATVIVYPNTPDDLFTPTITPEKHSSSHRYIEMKAEDYTPIPVDAKNIDWRIYKDFIFVKEKSRFAVYNTDGALVWMFSTPSKAVLSPGAIHFLGDAVFLATLDGEMYAFDIRSGQIIWYFESDTSFVLSPLVSKDKLVLIATGKKADKKGPTWRYQTLDAKTANPLFKSENFEQPLVGYPILNDDMMFFATRGGRLKAVQVSTAKTAWSADASSSFVGQPTLIGERIFAADESGLLMGFEASSGQRLHEILLSTPIETPLYPVEDSSIVVGWGADHSLMAVDLKANKSIWHKPLNMAPEVPILKNVKLTGQSLNQLAFASKNRGWTTWTACNGTNLCEYDIRSGVMLARVDLKGKPIENFEMLPEKGEKPARLFVPVVRADKVSIVGFHTPPSSPPKPPSNLTK